MKTVAIPIRSSFSYDEVYIFASKISHIYQDRYGKAVICMDDGTQISSVYAFDWFIEHLRQLDVITVEDLPGEPK